MLTTIGATHFAAPGLNGAGPRSRDVDVVDPEQPGEEAGHVALHMHADRVVRDLAVVDLDVGGREAVAVLGA